MAGEKYLVFARKWRPQSFEDVIGQEHITRTLQNAIAAGRIAHAFLFIGSRGIGKTTTARILAKALNCVAADGPTPNPCNQCDNCRAISEGNNMDVIEIDGASNNSVDDVREIRENVRLVPSRSRYKIYIIDEVHQLSPGAFNALLKTLEEPPAHAVFILATTEAHKVPATIISRCQRFDFRRVSVDNICGLLRQILDKEGIRCSDEALHAIARAAEGGMRDAESILDQLVSYCDGEITFQNVFDVLGLVDWRVLHELCDAVLNKDIAKQLEIIETVVSAGKDLSQFVEDILRYFRNLLVCKTGNPKTLLALPDNEIAEMQARADRFTLTQTIRLVEQFAELLKGYDSQLSQRIALEALLIQISKRTVEISVDTVLEKIMQLSDRLEGADVSTISLTAPAPPRASATAVMREVAPAPTPAPPQDDRVRMTSRNMAAVWNDVVARVSEGAMALQITLNQAKPVAVDGACLVLELDSGAASTRDALSKTANRAAIDEALQSRTENVTTYRFEVKEGPCSQTVEAPATSQAKGHGGPEIEKAMKDPHIANVLDVFKGRIVDVKHDVKPGPTE